MIGDDHRLQQVAWNLLANSVKPRLAAVMWMMLTRERGRAVVRVKDSGEGIDFIPAARVRASSGRGRHRSR